MAQSLFLWVLERTIPVTLVILAVLAARLLLKKAPKILSYLLWGVVLFRMLCPFSLQSPVGLLPDLEPAAATVLTPMQTGETAPLEGELTPHTADPLVPTEADTAQPKQNPLVPVWVCGAAALLLYSGVCYFKLRRRLVGSVREKGNVYLCDTIATPFVLGFFYPRIYLPTTLSASEREYILCHEQHHIRRGDHIFKVLAFLALCLYWFNPLCWVAFCLAGKDMEMSCDEAVLKKLGGSVRADYAASLLKLATGRRILGGTPLAFGEGSTKSRIKNLAGWKRPVLWVVVLSAVFALVLTACLAADRPADQEASAPPADQTEASEGIVQEGQLLSLWYANQNGQATRVELELPKGLKAEKATVSSDPFFPDSPQEGEIQLTKDGQVVALISTTPFGAPTEDLPELVDPATDDTLPMPIFAGIALSNHADFVDYTVIASGPCAATATARFIWQDLSSSDLPAVEIPWSSRPCILAYNWSEADWFLELSVLDPQVFSKEVLEQVAKSIRIGENGGDLKAAPPKPPAAKTKLSSTIEQTFSTPEMLSLLLSEYEKPWKMNLNQIFSGWPATEEVTEEEKAQYADAMGIPNENLTLVRLSAEEIESFLISVSGMDLDRLETQLSKDEGWVQLPDTGFWYGPALNPSASLTVLEAEVLETGETEFIYQLNTAQGNVTRKAQIMGDAEHGFWVYFNIKQ